MKEKSEKMLAELQEKMQNQKACIKGLTYLQLHGLLQQLHMQGEYTAVMKLGSALNDICQDEKTN